MINESDFINHQIFKEGNILLKKQRKWLSWALVIALLLSLLPANVQPAQAAVTNPTLASAINGMSRTLPVLNLANKNIAGKVDITELKGEFPNLVKVILKDNFITDISNIGSVTVISDGNLINPADNKLKFTDNEKIKRIKASPEKISAQEFLEKIVLEKRSAVTLKDLVTKGVVEKVSISYTPNGGSETTVDDTTITTDPASVDNAEIAAADVQNVDTTQPIKITVKYKDVATPADPVEKMLDLRVPSLKIDGVPAVMYRDNSEAVITVTKLDANDNPQTIAATNTITISGVGLTAPTALTATDLKLLNAAGAEVASDGVKLQAKIKIAGGVYEGSAKVKAEEGTLSTEVDTQVKAAAFTDFKLIEYKAGAPDTVLNTYTGTVAGANTPGLYMQTGSNTASFTQANFNALKALSGNSEGKFYVQVKEGATYRHLQPGEEGLLTITKPVAGYDYAIGHDAKGLFITFSAAYDAQGGGDKKFIIEIAGNSPKAKLTIPGVTLAQSKPKGFYIYVFDADTSTDAIKDEIANEAHKTNYYYVANNAAGETQDKVKFDKPINLLEGEEKVLIPVAEYEDGTRQIVPTTVQKFWYQKELNEVDKNFNENPRRFQPVASTSYELDSNGYPVKPGDHGTLTPYKGAPVTANIIADPANVLAQYGGVLSVKGQSVTAQKEDKFANLVLSLSGTNNPIGFWLQINWKEKEVSDYILVPKDFKLSDYNTNNLNTLGDADTAHPPVQPFIKDLEDALKGVEHDNYNLTKNPSTGGYELAKKQKVAIPIGSTDEYKTLVIYNNGLVKEVSPVSEKTTIVPQAGFQEGDIVLESTSSDGALSKFRTTEHAGTKVEGGVYTDGRTDARADYKIKDGPAFAELMLAPSEVMDVAYVIQDNKRLGINTTNPLETGEITKGEWHGELGKANLGTDDPSGKHGIVYVGNTSYNEKLRTRVYLVPVYSNKDLNLGSILANGVGDENFEKTIKQFAWLASDWNSETDKAVSYTAENRGFVAATAGDTAKMGIVQSGLGVKLKLAASVTDLGGHKFKTGGIVPGTTEKEIKFDIKEPLYDRVGAIIEKKIGTTSDYEKVTIAHNPTIADPDNLSDVVKIGADATNPTLVRTRLTNSNLYAARALGYNKGEFDRGVYFYGTAKADAAKKLEQPSTVGGSPNVYNLTGEEQKPKDIAILAYLSGVGGYTTATWKPVDYVNFAKAASNDPYDTSKVTKNRQNTLTDEAKKIVPKVYKKDPDGTYKLVGKLDNTTPGTIPAGMEVGVQSDNSQPGTFKFWGAQRGLYYVTFDTLAETVESPLVPVADETANPTDSQIVADNDLQNYDAAKPTYWFRMGVSQSQIETIYNYVPYGQTGITVEDNGNVRVNTMDESTDAIEFTVYPVVLDKWLADKIRTSGKTVPAKLDKDGIATILEATGKNTLKDVLDDPYSGLGYMKEADFGPISADNNWHSGNSTLITASALTEDIGAHKDVIKQQVRVSKGTLTGSTVGFKANTGEFDAAASLIKPDTSYTAAASAPIVAPVPVFQGVDALLQDIIVTPEGPQIASGGTAIFNAVYRAEDNTLVPITAENLTGDENAAGYLKITPSPNNPGEPSAVTITKTAATASDQAKIAFTATEAGTYTYFLTTKNKKDAKVPNLADGKMITFTVVPDIRTDYELWVGDEVTINLGNDLSIQQGVTFEPDPNNVLNTAKLAEGKLAIDANTWAGVDGTQDETVEVKVKKNGQYLGNLKLTVKCHPRGQATYILEPQTTFANQKKVDRTDNKKFLVQLRKEYADHSFEYVDLEPSNFSFQGGAGDDTGTVLDQSAPFLEFKSTDNPKTLEAVVKDDASLPADTEDWYGLWKVEADGGNDQLHVKLLKKDATAPVEEKDYAIYELKDGVLEDVSGQTDREFKLTDRERYLFIVNKQDPANLKVDQEAIVNIGNLDKVNYRMFTGDTHPALGDDPQNIKTNGAEHYKRIRISPKAAGEFGVEAADPQGKAASVKVTYKISNPANALKVRIDGAPAGSVTKGSALTLTAAATGGTEPTNYTYKWQSSPDNNDWTDVASATAETYTVPTDTLGTTYYRVIANNGSEQAVSRSATVTVVDSTPTPSPITAELEETNVNASLGGTAVFKVKVTGNTPTDVMTYEWTAKDPVTNTSRTLTDSDGDDSKITLSNLQAADFAQDYYVRVKANGNLVANLGPAKLLQGQINVKFDLGDGTTPDGSGNPVHSLDKAFAANHTIVSSDVPVVTPATGKSFSGWAPSDPVGYVVSAPKTFTAVYTTVPSGTNEIKFYVGSGTIASGNAVLHKANGATIAANEVPTVTPPTGYKFTGWDSNPVGYVVNGNKTFVAQYRALNNYTVEFKLGEGSHVSGSPALVQTMQEDHVILSSEVPGVQAPAAATFKGWSPSNPVGHKVTGNVTFTATFQSTGSGGGGGGGGAIVTPSKPDKPSKPTKKPDKPKEDLPPVELDQNYKLAYLQGYPGQVVRAGGEVTRGEVAAIFSRLLKEKMEEGKTYTSSFKDIESGKWYSNPIAYLESFKIISGYEDGTFKPDKKLTRAEFASVIARFAKLDTTKKTSFSDVSGEHWAKDYIDNAISHDWMGGYPDGTFKPNQPITRAEIVTVINKLINRVPDKAAIDADSANETKFKDLQKTYWAYYDVIEASSNR